MFYMVYVRSCFFCSFVFIGVLPTYTHTHTHSTHHHRTKGDACEIHFLSVDFFVVLLVLLLPCTLYPYFRSVVVIVFFLKSISTRRFCLSFSPSCLCHCSAFRLQQIRNLYMSNINIACFLQFICLSFGSAYIKSGC